MTSASVHGHNTWSYQVHDRDNTVPRAICRAVLINKDTYGITDIGKAGYIFFLEIDPDPSFEHLFKCSFTVRLRVQRLC